MRGKITITLTARELRLLAIVLENRVELKNQIRELWEDEGDTVQLTILGEQIALLKKLKEADNA